MHESVQCSLLELTLHSDHKTMHTHITSIITTESLCTPPKQVNMWLLWQCSLSREGISTNGMSFVCFQELLVVGTRTLVNQSFISGRKITAWGVSGRVERRG